MPWVYLIRNGELHKIGRQTIWSVDQTIAAPPSQTLETDRSRDLEFERIPSRHARLQTEYFRLTEKEVEEVRLVLGSQLRRRQEVRNGQLKELDPDTGYWRTVPGD